MIFIDHVKDTSDISYIWINMTFIDHVKDTSDIIYTYV